MTKRVITGKEFNVQFKGPFYKILAYDLTHNGFEYKEGLNIDHLIFNPSGSCQAGGLYFTDINNIVCFLNYGVKIGHVTIPDDAKVYIESSKYKANKIELSEIQALTDSDIFNDYNRCLKAVQVNGLWLKYVKDKKQTAEICLIAVRQNPAALKYVHIKLQTPEIFLAAVIRSPHMIQHVDIKQQTREICLAAVNADGDTLKYILTQTPELCEAAVRNKPQALRFVNIQTYELCRQAINTDYKTLKFVKPAVSNYEALCVAAIKKNGYAIHYIHNKTHELCLMAVLNNWRILSLLSESEQTYTICLAAVVGNICALPLVKNEQLKILLKDLAH